MANLASSVFGAIHEDVQYELKVTDVDDSLLRVAAFSAVEELSVPFIYTVTVGTDPESVTTLEDALGRDASFTILKDGKVARVVHGIVTGVVPDGKFVGKSQATVSIVIEPRMSNLQYSGGFRIFQEMAVNEIVGEICKPEQIECLWFVHPVPAKREYCTQFHETDLEFITRLASEEGMHFFFAHDEAKTTLVFVNHPKGYEEIEPDLNISFNETEGAVADEHVRSIQRAQRIRVGAFEHRDYHFIQPGMTLLARSETAGKETTANSHKRELRDYPGRFLENEKGKALAQVRLDELRSDAFVVTGTASSLRFTVGKSFALTGHREEGFNRPLLLRNVVMEGAVQSALRDGGFRGSTKLTSFTASPAELPIHPKRLPKPPSRLQSARVVGPKDGDPYVDDRGRVKVQFFWDREGKFDEKSSCWVRMATPVAHADEGFWQAHKVGAEVLVGFIDDDIDRPIVMCAVYNPVQAQPNPLPGEVAKSTWKTRSIPGNAGFNEITQDNSAGREVLYMHAQKDRRTVVLANHNETVGANQSATIGANQSITVGAARSVTVGATHTVTVGADETNKVKGKRTETVDTGESVTVKAGRTHTVATGDEALTVTAGNRTVKVPAGVDALTAKEKTAQVATTYDINADVSVTIHHKSDSTLHLEASLAKISTANKIELTTGPASITLEGGKITISAAESIEFSSGAAKMALKADGSLTLSGGKVVEMGCGPSSAVKLEPAMATMNGSAVNVTATGAMEISGAIIKIN